MDVSGVCVRFPLIDSCFPSSERKARGGLVETMESSCHHNFHSTTSQTHSHIITHRFRSSDPSLLLRQLFGKVVSATPRSAPAYRPAAIEASSSSSKMTAGHATQEEVIPSPSALDGSAAAQGEKEFNLAGRSLSDVPLDDIAQMDQVCI